MEIRVNLTAEELSEMLSTQSPCEIKDLIRKLIDDFHDEYMSWTVVTECLESLRAQYAEEADWYTERELQETFDNSDNGSATRYAKVRSEALTYQSATEHVLRHVRDISTGKPEQVEGE